MQIVLRDGRILATHLDGQAIDGLYPGCLVLTAPNDTPVEDGQIWPVDLEVITAAACARIDARAETLCNQVITPGSAQMARYQRKEGQARGYLEAQKAGMLPADEAARAEVYPAVYGEVGITAETPEAVATTIVAMADAWWAYGDAVEASRLAGKRAVMAAVDTAGVAAAEAAIVWPGLPG